MSFSTSECIYSFCDENGIECSSETAQKFDVLSQMLIEFNSHTNVTALKTEEDIAVKHFIDSFYPLKYDIFTQNANVIDIGCGAGFPGLPLKILRPDLQMSFVDSTAKKLKFTQSVSEKFDLGVKLYPERAEELVNKGHREKYDFAVSRAVASLPVLLELVLPYVKVGGAFVAYKSAKETNFDDKQSELSLSQKALKALGAKVETIYSAGLSTSDDASQEHELIVIRKIGKTPEQYPRRYAVIVKKPLV